MKSVSLFTALFLLVMSQNLWSQCPALSCNDRVQISLEADCESVITSDMLAENDPANMHIVEIYGDADTLIGNILTGAHIGQELTYKVINDCGNSCWGNITLEYNLPVAVTDVPCAFVPGISVLKEGSIDVFNQSDTAMIEPNASCQRTLIVTVVHNFAYSGGLDANGEVIWVDADALVTLIDAQGNVKGTFTVPKNETTIETLTSTGPFGKCTAIIEPADDRAFGSYSMILEMDNCGINPDCISWCGSVPDEFVTVDELDEALGQGCISPVIGDIRIDRSVTGDICSEDGELVVVSYSATVERHGQREKLVLMTQAYRTEKLSLAPTPDGGIETPVFFPEDISLGCNADASPEAIWAATGSGTLAYPYYTDVHNFVIDTIIREVLEHYEVVVDTIEEPTLISVDVDGDGDLEQVWGLTKVVKKELRDSIRLDTILGDLVNPTIIIEQQVCNFVVSYTDSEFPACQGGEKIVREWSIIDWCDSNATISDFQTIERFDTEAPVVLQPDNIYLSIDPWTCTARTPLPELDITDDCATEFDISINAHHGRIESGYLVDLPATQDSVPVELVVADGCGNETVTNFYVMVSDQIPPVMVCKDNLTVTLTTGGSIPGLEGAAKILASDFDAGIHDTGCGDVTVQVIRVDDMEEFIWDCEGNEVGFLPVSCNPFTEDVDLICEKDGSQFTPSSIPGESVSFCCEDVGKLIMVVVIATDAHGNQNQCMVEVSVVNKGGGSLVCEPVTVGCAADLEDMPSPIIVGGICASDLTVQLHAETNNDIGCGEGTIIREWFIDLDFSGDLSGGDGYCEQIVTVDPATEGFDPYTIKWPKHYDGTVYNGINFECNVALDSVDSEPVTVQMGDPFTCTVGMQDIQPSWCETECGLIGFSVESDTVSAGDACLKIVNRWTVIDWCLWESNAGNIDDENDQSTDSFIAIEDWAQGLCATCPDYGPEISDPVYFMYDEVELDGYYTFDQVIAVFDDSSPEILLESDTIFVNTIGGSDLKEGERLCVGSEDITADAVDFCNGSRSPVEILEWYIEVEDLDGNPVNNLDGTNVKVTRGPFATMNTRSGSPGDVRLIKWRVDDGCGNIGFATTTVIFRDLKAPSPVCVAGLTTVFMEDDGTAQIWARDFDIGSFDNCTNAENLEFSIVPQGEESLAPNDENFASQSGYTVFCDSIRSGVVDFDVYVWDINGLGDFCTVSLLFSNGCDVDAGGASAMISGQISTTQGRVIENVEVQLATTLPEYPISGLTGTEGIYAFDNNPMDLEYNIVASRDDNHDNGVSTLDLVLIQKHILGVSPFSDPYQLIAADASNDGKVSTVDLLEIRKIILSLLTEYTNNSSWRFVGEDYEFFDSSNPWPFIETLDIAKLEQNMFAENFIGIKIGDVNESAIVNQFGNPEIRSSETLTFTMSDQLLEKGKTYNIALSANQATQISGLQFGLNQQGLDVFELTSSIADFDDSNYVNAKDHVLVSWPIGYAIDAQSNILNIELKSNQNILLSDAIQLQTNTDNNYVSAEAYKAQTDEIMNIEFVFENKTEGSSSFLVAQNDPNPFKDYTKITFQLPEDGMTTISIHATDGRLVWSESGNYMEGFNEIEIHKSEVLLTQGSYFYTVESGQHAAARKMMVIE